MKTKEEKISVLKEQMDVWKNGKIKDEKGTIPVWEHMDSQLMAESLYNLFEELNK